MDNVTFALSLVLGRWVYHSNNVDEFHSRIL